MYMYMYMPHSSRAEKHAPHAARVSGLRASATKASQTDRCAPALWKRGLRAMQRLGWATAVGLQTQAPTLVNRIPRGANSAAIRAMARPVQGKDAMAFPVHSPPITRANIEEASASRPGVRGSCNCSLIWEDNSPTTPVKSDMAIMVPKPNVSKYVAAMGHDGIANAGITPRRWPDPEHP